MEIWGRKKLKRIKDERIKENWKMKEDLGKKFEEGIERKDWVGSRFGKSMVGKNEKGRVKEEKRKSSNKILRNKMRN